MELIRGRHNLRERHRGCVVTIGNFDGIHLGHQAILEQTISRARNIGAKSTVMLFEPQPIEFFAPTKAPVRVMSLRNKLATLANTGIDQVFCLHFGQSLASLTAQDFVDELLVEGLGAKAVIVGDDFHFGAGREGDTPFLRQAGKTSGFSVTDTTTVAWNGERISSTRVRAALSAGKMADAEQLLGRPYCISGRVRYGDQLGRELGFPTANLALQMLHAPVAGVYIVTVNGAGLRDWPGVASCGTRPAVNGKDNRLEVHLLDYHGNLYTRHLQVTFHEFLRPERNFDDLEALKAAVDEDINQTRIYFEQPPE